MLLVGWAIAAFGIFKVMYLYLMHKKSGVFDIFKDFGKEIKEQLGTYEVSQISLISQIL